MRTSLPLLFLSLFLSASAHAVPGDVQTNAPAKPRRAPKPVAPADSLIGAYQDAADKLNDPNAAAKTMQGQWRDRPDPIASPEALPGGSITYAASSPPKSLNPYLDNNTFTYQVFDSLFESLLGTDPITADYAPGIAQRWEISPDKLQFTFYLDPMAKWSDGKPITAEDVKWTFDAIMATNSQAGPQKVALRHFVKTPPVIVDPLTIRFTSDELHWRNLGAIGGMEILPAHIYRDKDFNKINSDFPVVSGPYRIESIQEGVSLTLKRRDDWWARSRASTRNTFNFDRVVYRFFGEQDNAFDAFLAGEVDVYPVYRAAIWAERTSGQKFDSNWIVKRRIRNHHPVGFQGFAMNLRRPPFDELKVRQALALLLNRQRMVETLMHNQYFLQRSYFESLYNAEHPCTNPVFDYNPERAAALLDEAGWKTDPRTGLRMKNGKPLSFTFLTRDESSDKFLALYGEDLRKAGVEMKIEREDWAAWTRDMDEYKFDMTWAAWSAGLEPDPESMWSSKEADRAGGNNITGFKDKMVDELIEAQKSIFNLQERNGICRRIDSIIAEQVPYILLWNIDAVRLLYWDKFGTPPTVLSKFGDERSLLAYWWYDDDSADDLADAQASGDVLPPRPDVVDFDETFAPAKAR